MGCWEGSVCLLVICVGFYDLLLLWWLVDGRDFLGARRSALPERGHVHLWGISTYQHS